MASKNRNGKKNQNGTSKHPVPLGQDETAVEGRLIDVQVWKTISKGKVQGTSVDIPEATTVGEAKPEVPRKPTKVIQISRGQLGKLIGPKGATIKKFEEHFSVQISQPAAEPGAAESALTRINIEGDDRDQVQNAVATIKQFLITGVAPWSEHQLITEAVEVPKRSVREILGDQGKTKILIGKHTRTQIIVPTVSDNDVNGTATIRITAARAEDIAKAKDIIDEIVIFHCHPVTHPDHIYMQMDVPQKYHGRILGLRGAHASRLEHEHNVRIFMPTQQQPNLVVVGDNEDNVARCLDAIEDIMDDTDKKDAAKAEADAIKAAKKAAKEEAKAAAAAAAAAETPVVEVSEETEAI